MRAIQPPYCEMLYKLLILKEKTLVGYTYGVSSHRPPLAANEHPDSPPDDSLSFGSALYRLRLARGLSQAELARRAAMSRSYLSEIENERRPALKPDEVFERIMLALNATAAEREDFKALAARGSVAASLDGQAELVREVLEVLDELSRFLSHVSARQVDRLARELKETIM